MYALIRPLLFRLDPERAHDLTLKALRLTGMLPPVGALVRGLFAARSLAGLGGQSAGRLDASSAASPVEVFGLRFSNAVGLAAGYDKDGLAWRGLACLGFGHIEVGTVTPRPQAGNPKPRIFRLPEDRAVINRMGFPGRGAAFVARQLAGAGRPGGLILGVNIGKNKETPLEEAARDYLFLFELFAPLADYLTVNVSSPNTVGLRRLQAREYLDGLLGQLAAARRASPHRPPILVKLAPDLSAAELEDALAAIAGAGMEGVIATNTTLSREGLGAAAGRESGGLSGAPLAGRSLGVVRKIVAWGGGRLPVVGVGGIMDPQGARAMLEAGASLIQLYTGLIYAGPGLVKRVLEGRGA
jgi:dihydroorotate dehydrogenase